MPASELELSDETDDELETVSEFTLDTLDDELSAEPTSDVGSGSDELDDELSKFESASPADKLEETASDDEDCEEELACPEASELCEDWFRDVSELADEIDAEDSEEDASDEL